jgi:hypothetical protein
MICLMFARFDASSLETLEKSSAIASHHGALDLAAAIDITTYSFGLVWSTFELV